MITSISLKGIGILLATVLLSACTEEAERIPKEVPKDEIQLIETQKELVVIPKEETEKLTEPQNNEPNNLVKVDSQKSIIKQQEPVKTEKPKSAGTQPYLSMEFFEQLKNGTMAGSKITFNHTIPQVHKMLGKPTSIGGVEGGDIHQYGKFGYINPSLEDQVVSIYYFTKGDKVTGEAFIKAWGKPTEQYPLEHPYDAYFISYRFNEYIVNLEMDNSVKDEVHYIQLSKIQIQRKDEMYQYLGKEFVADLKIGKMPYEQVNLDLTVSQIKQTRNAPAEIRQVEGGEVMIYGSYGYLYPSLSEEVVGYYHYLTRGEVVTGDDFIRYWGKPTEQGAIEHPYNAYIITYDFGKYMVNIEMDSSSKDQVNHFVILER